MSTPEAKQQSNDNARTEDLEDWSLTFPSDLPESVAFEIPLEKKVSIVTSIYKLFCLASCAYLTTATTTTTTTHLCRQSMQFLRRFK